MRHVPLRMCAACRQRRAKQELWRVCRTPDGRVVVDTDGKTPGRGAYLCRADACTERAKKIRALERALGAAIPADLFEQLHG